MKKTQRTRVGDTSLKQMPGSGKAMHGKQFKPASMQPHAHPKSSASVQSSSSEDEHQGPPTLSVPNLFHFVWKPSGRYEAEMETALYNRHGELCGNAATSDYDLSWALDIASKISPTALDYLVEKRGYVMLSMTDEACVAEFGKAPSSESRIGQISTMHQCCKIVLAIQRSLGSDLTDLMIKDAKGKLDARRRLMKKFNVLLSLLEGKRKHHKGATTVRVKRVRKFFIDAPLPVTEEYEEDVVLAARAIEVTQDLTTELRRLPNKKEVQDTMVKLHDELKTTIVNWSQCFKQAGLTKLPMSLPWGSSKPK
jgi:hypothetical protein